MSWIGYGFEGDFGGLEEREVVGLGSSWKLVDVEFQIFSASV